MFELLRIRPCDPQWKEFCGILTKAFNTLDPPDYAPSFRENYGFCKDRRIIGTAIVDIESEISVCITNVAVDPPRHRQGIGMEIMTQLCGYLSSRFQKARLATSVEKVKFYDLLGFELDRYQPSAQIQMMTRKLR